jgi:subtilase family serine protease
MTQQFSRTLLLAGACTLIGLLGCGAPPDREAEGLNLARLALNTGPDFVFRKLNVPPSAWPGGPLPVTVTVCNQGTEGASAPVEIVLSSDPAVSQDDAIIVSEYLGWLAPGQCATDTYYAMASVPSGVWHVGGIADRYDSTVESDETNNTRTSPPMGIGWAPDIVISEVHAPASIMPGQLFTASVRVCNQGTQPLYGGAEVLLVLSEDPDIRFSYDDPPQEQDLPLMSFQTVPLGVGQCKTQQVSLGSQPPHEGAWYLGAVADPHHYEPELITANNTRASELFGIGYHADYRIESVSGPASVTPGQLFTAAVKVCNQGTVDGGTEVQLVLSEDSTIVFDPELPPAEQDQPLNSFHTGPLAPGQCKTQQVQASAHVQQYGPWHLGAVADPGEYEQELIETNNTLASDAMGIGYSADYVIREVRGPASATPGQTFTASVRVCNQGTAGDGTQVTLVLSEDTDIHFSYNEPPHGQDQPLTSFHVAPLQPGQCRTQQVEASASPQRHGAWHLGAVADPGEYEPELIETNNTLASEPIGIGYDSDFTIASVSGPPSIAPGEIVTISVKVCNQGTVSGSTDVQLVLSEDTDIRFSYNNPHHEDLPLQSFHSGMLSAGQCRTQQVETAVNPPGFGGWYLGAIADPDDMTPELVETNNTRASALTGMGYEADYVIREISGPASIMPGQPFSASVTVCNQGTTGGHVDVQLVLSEDTDIRFSNDGPPGSQDLPLEFFSLPHPLEPGQCKTQQVQSFVQVPWEGTWHLGAVADPSRSSPELLEDNNTRASDAIGIGYMTDYVIRELRGPASVMPGQQLMASVTVCNQGTVNGGTEVQLVLSEDTDILFSYESPPYGQDLPLNSFYVQLAAGQCRTEQVELSVWAPDDGVWYLGAIADPGRYQPELIETNNARASKPMGIGYRADHFIQSVSTPASVTPGQQFMASVTVCNQGTVGSSTEVQLVLSEDTDIHFSYSGPPEGQDLPLNSFFVSPLEPGRCRTEQVELSAWAPHDGVWYLGAVADPGDSEPEFLETNNSRASDPIGYGFQPDYSIQAVSAPASVMPGQQLMTSVTVCNRGTVGGSTEVQLVLSDDTDIRFSYNNPPSGQDLPLGNFYTGPLEPGQCRTEQVESSAWVPENGIWYLGAVADPGGYEEEFLETNNSRASKPMGVGFHSDFAIQAVSGPPSVTPGQEFTASVTVCNQGTMSAPVDLVLVLSEDADIRFSYSGPYEDDMPLASVDVPGPLEPGQCTTQQVQTSVWVPHEGVWYLGAVADPGNYEPEFFENNNTLASDPVGIGFQPDYSIQSVSGPASVTPGAPLTASVTVCNQGTVSGSAQLELVLSEDTDIRFSYSAPPYDQDLPMANFDTGPLGAGQCRTQQVEFFAWAPFEGPWYLGVVADPGNYEQEFLESNNARASEPVGIGYHTDYRIESVSGPANVRPGDPVTVDVTVCNRGTVSGSTDVQVMLSEDTEIGSGYSSPPYQGDIPLDSFSTGMLEAGQCMTQQVQTPAWAPHEGLWHFGAVADPGGYEQEFLESNNTGVSEAVGIGFHTDYRIQSVIGPPSVRPGDPLTVNVTVCNQGTIDGSTEVVLVLSEDANIRYSYFGPPSEDQPLHSFFTGPLAAGQCLTQQLEAQVWPPYTGAWYLGAVADPGNTDQEFRENNNTRASSLMGVGYDADIVIQELTAPSVTAGQPYEVTVTVCNQGTASSPADVQLVLSEDPVIRFSYSGPPEQQDLPVEFLSFSNLEQGQCVTQNVTLSTTLPGASSWYVGAVADPGHYLPELIETNNSRASGVVRP